MTIQPGTKNEPKSPLQQESEKAAIQIRKNCEIFLKRAATEIASHSNFNDSPLSEETAAVVTVLTQMAVELAMAAYIVRHDSLRKIAQKSAALADNELISQWRQNELRTVQFEELKSKMNENHSGIFRVISDVVDQFQKMRNKLVHLAFHFDEADRYDLKYQAIFLIIHTASALVLEKTEFPHTLFGILSKETSKKLIAYKPYQHEVEKLARQESEFVLECPICDVRAFGTEPLRCLHAVGMIHFWSFSLVRGVGHVTLWRLIT